MQTRFAKDIKRRSDDQELIEKLKAKLDKGDQNSEIIKHWERLSQAFSRQTLIIDERLSVIRHMGNPAWFNKLMQLATAVGVRVPNLYGYDRAYQNDYKTQPTGLTVLDPTSGGGSIPFEAIRLGHNVIANELNPVATTILHATLDFPARFGESLLKDIKKWGEQLETSIDQAMLLYFPTGNPLPEYEKQRLAIHLGNHSDLISDFDREEVTTYLYCRQVTCPSCLAKTPLLNTFWLSKEAKDPGGVKVVTSGSGASALYRFDIYQAKSGQGPNGENPEVGTVKRGIGQCVHCKQAIEGDEIKAQARGESVHGYWKDELYAVVAVRHQPKLDKKGHPQYFSTGARKGEVKTEKIRFFRVPNETDLAAIEAASNELKAKWNHFDE